MLLTPAVVDTTAATVSPCRVHVFPEVGVLTKAVYWCSGHREWEAGPCRAYFCVFCGFSVSLAVRPVYG